MKVSFLLFVGDSRPCPDRFTQADFDFIAPFRRFDKVDIDLDAGARHQQDGGAAEFEVTLFLKRVEADVLHRGFHDVAHQHGAHCDLQHGAEVVRVED